MTLANQLNDFRNYLSQLGYGSSTQKMLPVCVNDFLSYHRPHSLTELKEQHIQTYYNYLHNRPHKRKPGGLSESYIHHHVYALKVFFNWLEETQQISGNPISVMKFIPPRSGSREPLSQPEINQLFIAAGSLKERAVLHLFYSCGLRRSEGEALNSRDIHFKQQVVYVRAGKGAKRRAVPMPAKVAKELE